MKNARFLLLTLILLLCASQSALAGGWGVPTTVVSYYVWGDGNAHFRVANNQNLDNCTVPQYLTLLKASANFDKMYATLVAAHVSKTPVSLFYNGCTSNYPLIIAIAVGGIW